MPFRRGWMMAAQCGLLVIAVVLTTAAADTKARFDKLGHQIMCSCGCNELLLECNHVGCPNSDGMRQELMAGIDQGRQRQDDLRRLCAEIWPDVAGRAAG